VGAHFEAQRIRPRASLLGRASRVEGRRVRTTAVRIALWTLIGLFSLALVGQLLYHVVVRPRVILARIEVHGDPILTGEAIAKAAGLEFGSSLIAVDSSRVRTLLESLPEIRRATVEKRLPDTLLIGIEARRGLAKALVPAAEGTVPIVFDEEGLVFGVGAAAAAGDLPVISGLGFARWQPGTRLPAVLRPLLEDLQRLRVEEPGLFAFISEVEVTRRGDRDLEVLIYPAAYATPIRAGSRITPELLKNAALLLDVMRRERLEERLQEVDLRAREVVFREKSGG
jgi:cell division protein FtsQ